MPNDRDARRSKDFVDRFSLDLFRLDSEAGDWQMEQPAALNLKNIHDLLAAVKVALPEGLLAACDIGYGPAARELTRYLDWGWQIFGCDASPEARQSAVEQLRAHAGVDLSGTVSRAMRWRLRRPGMTRSAISTPVSSPWALFYSNAAAEAAHAWTRGNKKPGARGTPGLS